MRIPETKKDSLFCARTHLKEKYIYKCHTAKTKQYSWCHRQTISDLSVKKWRAPDSFFLFYLSTYSNCVQYYGPKPTPTGRLKFVVLFSYPISGAWSRNKSYCFVFLFFHVYMVCFTLERLSWNYFISWFDNRNRILNIEFITSENQVILNFLNVT